MTQSSQGEVREFREFVDSHLVPYAQRWDRDEGLPSNLIVELGKRRYLGLFLSEEFGGRGSSFSLFGHLSEQAGRGCSSARSLITVQAMVAQAIHRCGSPQQRERWLPKIARGEAVAAFALTEPHFGSDAKGIQARAEMKDDVFVLNGQKKWISFGQISDLFLVFAQSDKGPIALLVERDTAGLHVEPIGGLLGVRASMLAELEFHNCRVPVHNLVGGYGLGIAAVAFSGLELGRYSVACGSVGLISACRGACLRYAAERKQFGVALREHQLVCRMLTDMIVDYRAARALCLEAGKALDSGDRGTTGKVLAAKYFASRAAVRASLDAVQIHGANGFGSDFPVARYLRDAKALELVEGSSEMQQILIAQNEYQTGGFDDP